MKILFVHLVANDINSNNIFSADLDELESIVAPVFASIENKNIERMIFHEYGNLWGEEEYTQQRIYVVPKNDINLLRIYFPAPNVLKQYKTAVSLSDKVIISL